MRSFSVLPCLLLLAFILYTTLPVCAADEQNQSNQNKQSKEDNQKASGEESCEEGDEDCEEVSDEGSDVEYESCEEGEEGCEEVSCESGEEGCVDKDSEEGKDKDKKDESNGTCEISCYCHDDKKSECALEKPKPATAQHPQQQQPKPRSQPHDSHSGVGTAAGVAAGAAAAAAAAGAAAHHQSQKKDPQHKPPPPADHKPQQQPKPKQEQKPTQDDNKCNWCIRPKCNPGACAPKKNFDAKKDADDLHAAMKGVGTKETVLIDILTHRSEEQLELIRQAYQGTGGGLDDDVRGDTSLKVQKILLALLQSRAEFLAEELHKAFEDDNESAMIMILTSISPCAVRLVGSAYSKKYNNKPLAKAAEDASAFKFEDFLVELIKGNREKDETPNTDQAIKDAKALKEAGADSWFFKGKDTFVDIFTHRSYSQLREIKKQYEILKPKPGFMKDIEEHSGGGKLTKGLLVMMKNVLNQPRYFADEIEGSLDKPINPFGIRDNDKLVRVVRGRCGLDLGDIRDAYPKYHDNQKLIDRLKGKSMGDYEDVLEAMMTQQPQ